MKQSTKSGRNGTGLEPLTERTSWADVKAAQRGRVMKFAKGMVGYIAVVSALVALSITGVSYAVAPYGTTTEAVKADRAPEKLVEPTATKTAALSTVVSDTERQPTWIAPTHKYPVSALNMKVNQGKQRLVHGPKQQNDWRLQERQTAFSAPATMTSYAPAPRVSDASYQPAPRYREPMQFRERTEAR